MDMMISDYDWSRVPWHLVNTAADWHDGPRTALCAFGHRKPANAEKVLREVRDLIERFPDISTRDMQKMEDLRTFVQSHVTRVKAVRKLKGAIMECAVAGADIHQVDEWRKAAQREIQERRETDISLEGEAVAPGHF